MRQLLLGIKRRVFRDNDAKASRADAEFRALRPGALAQQQYRCVFCGYRSSEKFPGHQDLHHLDDDHQNNAPDNLLVACQTCHPYHHVGEVARRDGRPAEGLGAKTMLAVIPEVSPADLNLLQRAIGAALKNEDERPVAEEIIRAFAGRCDVTKDEFGTYDPASFAAAMAELSEAEYAHRGDAIADLRLLFKASLLNKVGEQFLLDNPGMGVERWASVYRTIIERKASPQAQQEV